MTLAIVEPGGTAVIVETGDVKPAPTIRIIVTAWRREQSSYAAFYNTSCWLFFRTVATDLVAALVALLVPAVSRSPDDVGTVLIQMYVFKMLQVISVVNFLLYLLFTFLYSFCDLETLNRYTSVVIKDRLLKT